VVTLYQLTKNIEMFFFDFPSGEDFPGIVVVNKVEENVKAHLLSVCSFCKILKSRNHSERT
jgi:hypothetical protein